MPELYLFTEKVHIPTTHARMPELYLFQKHSLTHKKQIHMCIYTGLWQVPMGPLFYLPWALLVVLPVTSSTSNLDSPRVDNTLPEHSVWTYREHAACYTPVLSLFIIILYPLDWEARHRGWASSLLEFKINSYSIKYFKPINTISLPK